MPYLVSQIQQIAQARQKDVPKLSFLVEELRQLQQEFGKIDFDKGEGAISVVTDPVTLEGVYLGPFQVQLQIDKLCELYKGPVYQVIALDPNPAATAEDVTHPHVSKEQLCEGDGAAAIWTALEQGRMSDFFTMVRSILDTYNPDSPYVSLSDWHGEPCYDCGYVVDSERSYFCQFCDRNYCEECSTYCLGCEESLCLGCAGQCTQCGHMFCRQCVSACEECKRLFCEKCLEDEICSTCKERKTENEKQETQIKGTDENTNQTQTNSSEVKLAS